ncbi:hypothetical protein PR002_g8938 [Phytophthora rubi]|uniref:Uncharacterized protein n=1 Tax=Phytophthora rubi TaxID=129364 RepID=A0A6A3MVU0_9STRA|nr:hypothetical protein PR002_g8938 [Phytophthora rubi]
MSAVNSSARETLRPPSQPRDQLVLQVANVALSGRLLSIEIFEVQNSATPKTTGTPSSPLRGSTPLPSTPLTPSRTAGFRVAARDDVENEYSLFVTRQKAEYLYRAAYPVEAAATEVISLEAMANGILGHLNIIGNRQRDVGKLVCREPEPHVEKKTRVLPASTPPDKQRNPHLPSKRQDQRAVRVNKTSKRTMEAVAKAMRRHEQDTSGDDESAGSEAESGKMDRKSSEASILHRMAVADSKTMWKAELETNYEESEHAPPLIEEEKDINAYKIQPYTLAPGLSPVKRALPERKTKHKDLEERRQKGRQQRIRATQAAHEAPTPALSSLQAQSSYKVVIEETEHDVSGEGSRRSSMVTGSSTEKSTPQPRASSAPRSSAIVGNAYALENLPGDTSEPEQFLRRRPSGVHRSVLRKDHWQDEIGMGVEITAERPPLQTPPTRLDVLLGTAKRAMMVSSFQRSTVNLRVGFQQSRTTTSPALTLLALGASHSAPILQSPKFEKPTTSDQLANAGVSFSQTVINKQFTADDTPAGEERTTTPDVSINDGARPLARSTSTDTGCHLSSESASPRTGDGKSIYQSSSPVEAPESFDRLSLREDVLDPEQPMPEESRAESQSRSRQRSNSVGSEGIVRLAPLLNVVKPVVQEFLTPSEPGVIVETSEMSKSEVVEEKETTVPLADPEVIMFPSIDSTTEVNEEIAADKSEEIRLELPQAAVPSFQDVKEMQACDNSFLPIIGTITTENEDTGTCEPRQSAQVLPPHSQEELTFPLAIPLECWEEQTDSTTSSDTRREQTEELLSNATTLEERTSDDQKPVNDDVSRVIAPVPDIGVDTPTQGQNFYPKENNSDVQENKSQYAVENASSVAKVQVNEDYQEISDLDGRNSDIVGSDVLSEDNEGENDATHPRSSDTISNADSILPSPRNIGEFSDTSDVGDDKRCTTLANDVYQLELPQEENVACADPDDIKTLASVIHQQHVDKETDFEVGGSIGETTGIPFGVVSASDSELEPLAHDDDPPVTSGPSIIFEPAMHLVGGEERASAILGQDEKLSLEKHDDDEMKHTKAAEFIPSASPGQTPSPSEKTKVIARKKSLSPSKKSRPISPTEKAKGSSKGSRRRTTVAQVPDVQVIAEPTPKLERRHTAEDVKRRNRARRMSTFEKSDVLPDLVRANTSKNMVATPAEKCSGPALRLHNKLQVPSKRHASQHSGVGQSATNYHKKWGKWLAGRNIIEKVGCLQLEDVVVADPRNEENVLKLGLRYARWSGTSMSGILLLEHAALLHKNATGTQDYWFWLGSAHLDIFMRHRKYLPVAYFHLSKSLRAFTSAFAYIGSLADPLLLLRYAIGLFWHKGDGNLEKTRDIFLELFSQFVSFCDKDRPNLVFLQFQVFHRLKLYVDAIECMNKVIALHESIPHQPTPVGGPVLTSANALAHFAVYNAADYRLMLMQCQQASGDYVAAAQSLASVLKLKGIQQDTTLRDEQYFDLWYSLAEKCFHHEDYALALEYYAIALNFAKQSQVLAAIHYNLGLCFQSLGEDNKCVTEYKRARTANRHVPPLVSLTELSTPYDERFAQLLQKTVVQTIEEVRVELYGRAVRRLQRVFRQSRRNLNINLDNKTSDIPQAKMPSLSKRRLSIALARNPPALVKIEDAVEESDVHEEDNVLSKAVITDDNQVSKREESALEITERRHESFLVRKQAAVEEMADLLANPQYRGRGTSPSSRPNARVRAGSQLRSGLLSPEKDRLDVRRKQSMETFRQLGYVSSTMPWIEFWEKLLVLALDLFETRQTLYASIARVRGRLPLVADDVAFCALAESIGNVHEAVEKLHDPAYERELTYVCAVIEVSKQLVQHFPLGPGQLPVKSPHVSLPTVSSPRTDTDGSHNSMGATIPGRTVLPPYSPTREASASNSNSKQHLRLNQMLNLHFQEHVQQQEAAIAIAEATGGFAHPQRRMEKLAVLKDFRKANDVLLSSQLAFGSERATT